MTASGLRCVVRALTVVFTMGLFIGPRCAGAQENARVTTDTYIYLYPDSARQPFAKVEANSLVTVLDADADWFNISIVDTKGTTRYGYVSQQAIQRFPPTFRTSRPAVVAEASAAVRQSVART